MPRGRGVQLNSVFCGSDVNLFCGVREGKVRVETNLSFQELLCGGENPEAFGCCCAEYDEAPEQRAAAAAAAPVDFFCRGEPGVSPPPGEPHEFFCCGGAPTEGDCLGSHQPTGDRNGEDVRVIPLFRPGEDEHFGARARRALMGELSRAQALARANMLRQQRERAVELMEYVETCAVASAADAIAIHAAIGDELDVLGLRADEDWAAAFTAACADGAVPRDHVESWDLDGDAGDTGDGMDGARAAPPPPPPFDEAAVKAARHAHERYGALATLAHWARRLLDSAHSLRGASDVARGDGGVALAACCGDRERALRRVRQRAHECARADLLVFSARANPSFAAAVRAMKETHCLPAERALRKLRADAHAALADACDAACACATDEARAARRARGRSRAPSATHATLDAVRAARETAHAAAEVIQAIAAHAHELAREPAAHQLRDSDDAPLCAYDFDRGFDALADLLAPPADDDEPAAASGDDEPAEAAVDAADGLEDAALEAATDTPDAAASLVVEKPKSPGSPSDHVSKRARRAPAQPAAQASVPFRKILVEIDDSPARVA